MSPERRQVIDYLTSIDDILRGLREELRESLGRLEGVLREVAARLERLHVAPPPPPAPPSEGGVRQPLEVKVIEPVPVVTLRELYDNYRWQKPDMEVPISLQFNVPAGYRGTIEVPMPEGLYCIQRFFRENGDPWIKWRASIDVPENEAIPLHNVYNQELEFATFWVKRDKIIIEYENEDDTKPAFFQILVNALFVKGRWWDEYYEPLISRHSRAALPPPPETMPE